MRNTYERTDPPEQKKYREAAVRKKTPVPAEKSPNAIRIRLCSRARVHVQATFLGGSALRQLRAERYFSTTKMWATKIKQRRKRRRKRNKDENANTTSTHLESANLGRTSRGQLRIRVVCGRHGERLVHVEVHAPDLFEQEQKKKRKGHSGKERFK